MIKCISQETLKEFLILYLQKNYHTLLECNKYIWEHSSSDSSDCVQAFLDAPLWDGKKFYDVEKEIAWADP